MVTITLDATVFIIGVAIVLAVMYYSITRASHANAKAKRELQIGADGELVAIGERIRHSKPITLRGKGTFASDSLELLPGVHKLEYHFPDGVLVSIKLFDVATGEDETLVIKSGIGSAAFSVEGGRYVFQIEPADDSASWQLDVRQIS